MTEPDVSTLSAKLDASDRAARDSADRFESRLDTIDVHLDRLERALLGKSDGSSHGIVTRVALLEVRI